MYTHRQFRDPALLFRGLANERRLFMLSLLLVRSHTGVELQRQLGIRPACVSKHLGKLMTAGLVKGKRKRMAVQFSVTDAERVRLFISQQRTPFS